MKTISVLGSGKGSNFQAIINAINSNYLKVKIGCVISDVEYSNILNIAKQNNIPNFYIIHKNSQDRKDANEFKIINLLKYYNTDLVVLAGFMKIIKSKFLEEFSNRIINIHPSLLPSFPGLRAWEQALNYGVKITGCTVHYVDSGIDTGKIIHQISVPINPTDTYETLYKRIQEAEHRALPEVLNLLFDFPDKLP